MSFSPRTQLTHARHVFAVGARPLADRPVATFLKSAISAGLLGVMLSAAGPAAAHDHEGAPRASLAPAAFQVDAGTPTALSTAPTTHQAAFVDTVFARKAPTLSWVLPTGQVDGLELINQWKDGGITPNQAFELISLLAWTQSPVIARTQQVEDQARAQSQATQSIFEVKTHDQAAAFLSRTTREDLVLRGVLHASEGDSAMVAEDRDWQAVVNYWQIMSSDRLDETTSLPGAVEAPQAMAAARERLLRAVDDAGLAGLRVPLATFNDSDNVERLAERLEQANAELQTATGWTGPVLGLRGRVMLTVMAPLNMSLAFPQQAGQVGLVSAWEDVGHEWIHAVDFALRTAPGDLDTMGGFTLTQQLIDGAPQGALQQAWRDLPNQLREASLAAGNAWYRDRDARVAKLAASSDEDEQWQARYIGSRHETLAYAWQSHLQARAIPGALLVDTASTRNATDGVMGPRASEDASVEPVWKQTMAKIGQLWWQPAPTLAEQLQARRAPTAPVAMRGPRP